jgi:16S rRNA (guanine527-N7)-methyltransferase
MMTPRTDQILEEGLRRLGESDQDVDRLLGGREIPRLLHSYIEEIELFNPSYGLVAVRDRRELVVKHILDSLAPLGIIYRLINGNSDETRPGPPEIADVGSGAGLPGIPLAIALPRCQFTLIERSGRRAGFLRNTLAVLGLPNAGIREVEMEKAPPARFDLAVFRAFRPLEAAVLGDLFRLLRRDGVLAAYKGRKEKIRAETEGLSPAQPPAVGRAPVKPPGWEIFPCPVPFLEEERHLAVIRPAGYPG